MSIGGTWPAQLFSPVKTVYIGFVVVVALEIIKLDG